MYELNIDITEEDIPMHVNKDKMILHLADIYHSGPSETKQLWSY